MPNFQSRGLKATFLSGLYPSTCLTWIKVPGTYLSTSIGFQMNRACRPSHHIKVVDPGGVIYYSNKDLFIIY
jgi:hypothetical protein